MTTFLVILAIVLFVLGLLSFSAGVKGPNNQNSSVSRRRRKRTYNNGEKPYGLPWMGGTMKRRDKNFWDD